MGGEPPKWVPKVGERVAVFHTIFEVINRDGVESFVLAADAPGKMWSGEMRPDPVPLLREFVFGRKYLVPAGAIIICAYCHKYQGDHAPSAPEYGQEFHEEGCVVLRARVGYPETAQEE
jgi:hypothetical protein